MAIRFGLCWVYADIAVAGSGGASTTNPKQSVSHNAREPETLNSQTHLKPYRLKYKPSPPNPKLSTPGRGIGDVEPRIEEGGL